MPERTTKLAKLMPLEYLLGVMRNPSADVKRRDWAAAAAAPYCHAKLTERQIIGQKDRQANAARQAGVGTGWSSDLEFDGRAN